MIFDLKKISQEAPFDPDTAEDKLRELVQSLYRDHYWSLAGAISRYLLIGGTMDEAFGLSKAPKRGAPRLRRDEQMRQVFKLRLENPKLRWKEIARQVNWRGDIDNLRKVYREIRDQLIAEELGNTIKNSGSTVRITPEWPKDKRGQ